METNSLLWEELSDLFETDDGSLPEVRVNYTNSKATIEGYALLRRRASSVSQDSRFWSILDDVACPLDSVPNAAALVVSGDAEAFHVVLGGISTPSGTVPDLGVFVFPDQLALDYRMGPEWGPTELEALFELLDDLTVLDPGATLSPEEGVTSEVVTRFQEAWKLWASMMRNRQPDS